MADKRLVSNEARVSTDVTSCPGCGGVRLADQHVCRECRLAIEARERPLEVAVDGNAATAEVPPSAPAEISHVTFSLGSLMLIVTLCAVAAAITAQLPGLGVLFIAVAAVALTRTVQGANRSRAAGAACGVTEKIAMFLQSLAIVSLLFLLSGAAFVATCFPLGLAMFQIDFGYGFPFAFAIGLAAGGFVLYKLGRMTWPFRD